MTLDTNEKEGVGMGEPPAGKQDRKVQRSETVKYQQKKKPASKWEGENLRGKHKTARTRAFIG